MKKRRPQVGLFDALPEKELIKSKSKVSVIIGYKEGTDVIHFVTPDATETQTYLNKRGYTTKSFDQEDYFDRASKGEFELGQV